MGLGHKVQKQNKDIEDSASSTCPVAVNKLNYKYDL
jgi:hypothetical protein